MAEAARVLPQYGAALASVIDRFGGRVVERESFPSIGVAPSAACGNDPNRLALIFINLSANTIVLGLRAGVTLTTGVLLGANGGSMALDVIEDLTLSTREWFAIASGAGSPLYVLEVTADIAV